MEELGVRDRRLDLIKQEPEWNFPPRVGFADALKIRAALADFGDHDFGFPGVHHMTLVVGLTDGSSKEQKLPWSNREMEKIREVPAADPGSTGCPLDPVLKLLASKWLVHIVWYLGRSESMRFAELQRQLPGTVSAKVLSARLRELDALGIVQRVEKSVSPPHVEYHLTEHGHVINDFLTMVEGESRRLFLIDSSRISAVLPPNS